MEEEKKAADEAAIDPLEFAPEVDVLATFDGAWMDAVQPIKKWDEKVAKLKEIVEACRMKRIKPGNFTGLAGFLKKEAAGANAAIAVAAINAATALATGLKKDFAAALKELVPAVLLKYKEKKAAVQEACNNFFEAAIGATNLEELREEIVPHLTHNAPAVKNGTLRFVEKACQVTYIDQLQRIEAELLPAMGKAIEDKDGTVREAALHCMGLLKGRYGESVMQKYLKDVNKQKAEKIDEAAKEIKPSKYDRPENWKPPVKKAAPKKKAEAADDGGDELMDFGGAPKRAPPKGLGKKPVSKKKADADGDEPKKEEKKAAPTLSSGPPKKAAAGPTKAPTVSVEDEDVGAGLSKEDAIQRATDFFSAGAIGAFEEAKWQAKQEGFNTLQTEIQEKQPSPVILEAAAKFIKAKMKDWKESNINLQKGIVATF